MGENSVHPDDLADSYFEAIINKEENGVDIDVEKFAYDWTEEIEKINIYL